MNIPFRLAWEGLQTLINYIGDGRRVSLNKDDLITLLQNNNPMAPPEIAKLHSDTQERLKNLGNDLNIFKIYSK